jgi:hypothetical protein
MMIYTEIYAHPRGRLKQAMIEALHQEKPAHSSARMSIARTGFVPEQLRLGCARRLHAPNEEDACLVAREPDLRSQKPK